MYTPNVWEDRSGTGLNKFIDQNGNEYEFTPNPDSITQQGTAFSASWMNHIEQGLYEAEKGQILYYYNPAIDNTDQIDRYRVLLVIYGDRSSYNTPVGQMICFRATLGSNFTGIGSLYSDTASTYSMAIATASFTPSNVTSFNIKTLTLNTGSYPSGTAIANFSSTYQPLQIYGLA